MAMIWLRLPLASFRALRARPRPAPASSRRRPRLRRGEEWVEGAPCPEDFDCEGALVFGDFSACYCGLTAAPCSSCERAGVLRCSVCEASQGDI